MKKNAKSRVFTSCNANVNGVIMAMLCTQISRRTRWCCLKCVIVYLARDIPSFVKYCIYGESGLSLLTEYANSICMQSCFQSKYIF